MNTLLQEGQKYTIVSITRMAATLREEIVILTCVPELGLHFYRKAGKNKSIPLRKCDLDDALVFEGHHLPLVVDTDTDQVSGNSSFNLVTNCPDALRTAIRENCINPTAAKFQKILYHRPDGTGKEGGEPLFPNKN